MELLKRVSHTYPSCLIIAVKCKMKRRRCVIEERSLINANMDCDDATRRHNYAITRSDEGVPGLDRLAKIFQVSLAPNQAFSRHTAYTSPRNPITLNWNHEFYIFAIPNEDNDPCSFYSLTFVRSSMNLSIKLQVSTNRLISLNFAVNLKICCIYWYQ